MKSKEGSALVDLPLNKKARFERAFLLDNGLGGSHVRAARSGAMP